MRSRRLLANLFIGAGANHFVMPRAYEQIVPPRLAREPEHFPRIPRWALYARLVLQPLMMLWAWRATRQ
jgi:uncharacterized membrane protein